jgi:hypothetical protein
MAASRWIRKMVNEVLLTLSGAIALTTSDAKPEYGRGRLRPLQLRPFIPGCALEAASMVRQNGKDELSSHSASTVGPGSSPAGGAHSLDLSHY